MIAMIGVRLQNYLVMFGIGALATVTSVYAFYPQIQEARLIKLLKKLDREERYEEMKEIMDSPYLQNYRFTFKENIVNKTKPESES